MKKSIIAALLAVTLTFASCGDVEATMDALNEAISEAASEAVEEGAEKIKEEVEDLKEEYSYGELTEVSYKNEYLGYQFNAPEGVTLENKETLAQLIGLASDMIADNIDDNFAQMVKNNVLYEMYASYEDGTNLVVAVQENKFKLDDLQLLADSNAEQLTQLQNMEINISPDRDIVVVAGHDFIKLSASTSYEGISLHQDSYMAFIKDMVMNFTISYTDGNEDKAEALFNAITAY